MNDAFGMDDDLGSYTDEKLHEALRNATRAQKVASGHLSEANKYSDKLARHANLTETLQTLTRYVDRLTAEMARRGIS
jgi:hypothetical protein